MTADHLCRDIRTTALPGEAHPRSSVHAIRPPRGATPTVRDNRLRGLGRLAVRLPGFAALVVAALWDYRKRRRPAGKELPLALRAEWLRHWSRRALRLLNVRLTAWGMPPEAGFLAANHLGYLDVLVLAAAQPLVFVAKSEVRDWPVFGTLARRSGTLFINRQHRSDVARLAGEFAPGLRQGVCLALFLEGTSTGGDRVLPFHSALLAPAVEANLPVTPAWIGYAMDDGNVSEDVCYWRDMSFVPHFLNLLAKREIRACILYGDPIVAAPDRKRLARELHTQVCALREDGNRLLA